MVIVPFLSILVMLPLVSLIMVPEAVYIVMDPSEFVILVPESVFYTETGYLLLMACNLF